MEEINKRIEVSKKIIIDCSLENGGIVAANTTKDYYPSTAKNYLYIWPRDASYACVASDITGISNVQENFFNWCLNYLKVLKQKDYFMKSIIQMA